MAKASLAKRLTRAIFGYTLATSAASGIANAATRSAINGESFGRNLIAALPDVIAQAVGGAIGDGVKGNIDDARINKLADKRPDPLANAGAATDEAVRSLVAQGASNSRHR